MCSELLNSYHKLKVVRKSSTGTFLEVVNFIKSLYPCEIPIPLHEPYFAGNEKKYLIDAIDSTFVSSAGEYVDRLEKMLCEVTGARFAIATVNGTSALHTALTLSGVESSNEVITQPLSFVATANAISYCGASPVFVDVEKETLGLSPEALESFLKTKTSVKNKICYNIATGRQIKACVPMHTFGHPCRIDAIADICGYYCISLIEDAAESLGSTYKTRHTGTFGAFGIYSFNGNKTVTCGGGGAIVTNDENLAKKAKHITTTARMPHPYEYIHDLIGYNYRMPNLNAALACAQLEQLGIFIEKKRDYAKKYQDFFESLAISFVHEPDYARSNYWLNAIILPDRTMRDEFLKLTNEAKVVTRPVWRLLNKLDMYKRCQTDNLTNAQWLEERLVNIPSSVSRISL